MTRGRKARDSAALIPIDARLLRHWTLPAIDSEQGKVGRGLVLVVGGSVKNPGAVMLAGVAALRAGAGRLQIATATAVAPFVGVCVPEAMVMSLRHDTRGELSPASWRAIRSEVNACDTLLIGPGMLDARAATALLTARLNRRSGAATVVDAGALGSYAGATRPRLDGAILTPHAGEMAKICRLPLAQVLENPLQIARDAAARYDAVVVLKGAESFIAAPDGQAFHNTAGGLGLGTSGSGDTLAGLIAGLSARGAEPLQAAVWGVHLHALAGERLAKNFAPLGFLARELSTEVPRLLAELGGGAAPPAR